MHLSLLKEEKDADTTEYREKMRVKTNVERIWELAAHEKRLESSKRTADNFT